MPQERTTVLIVGAGIAGLAAAYDLSRRGIAVVVLEKSRGLGGRLATRRLEDGRTVDHGAQYVTARGVSFRHILAESGARSWAPLGEDWWIGTPGMSGLVAPLAAGLDIRREVTVGRVVRTGDGVVAYGTDGTPLIRADAAIIATPAPQAEAMTGIDLSMVEMAPCWTVIARFDRPTGATAEVMRHPRPDIAWICRQTTRRSPAPDSALPEDWVIQANADWSVAHLELPPDEAAEALRPLFPPELQRPDSLTAHRWRYALVRRPLGRPCLAEGAIVLAGDWCLAPRVEAAYDSGRAAALSVQRHLKALVPG